MPSLNQLIGGKVKDRIRLKRQWLDVVINLSKKLQPVAVAHMRYDFFEFRGGRGRDPLNILAGAAKIVEDGLVAAGVLPDDHQGVIKGIELGNIVHRPKAPGVLVTVTTCPGVTG